MKKNTCKYYVMAIAVSMLAACGGQADGGSGSAPESGETPVADAATVDDAAADSMLTSVTTVIPFAGQFHSITNVSDVDIEFREGDYSIEVEGPDYMTDMLRVSVDSDVLTVSQLEEGKSNAFARKMDLRSGVVRVSCPDLRMVAVCGGGNFRSVGAIHSASMHVGTLSHAKIQMDTVSVDGTFLYETSNDGDAEFRYIDARGDATVYASDGGKTTLSVRTLGDFTLNGGANADVKLRVDASRVDLLTVGNCRVDMGLATDSLRVEAFDKSNVKLTWPQEPRNKNIKKGKNAVVTEQINVDIND